MGVLDDIRGLSGAMLGAASSYLLKAEKPASEEGQESTPGGRAEDTAKNSPVPTEMPKDQNKALLYDPFAVIEQLGYKDRPSQLSYGTLRAMVHRTPIIHAIIRTRMAQVAAFSNPQKNKYQLGFKIKLRESKKEPTKAERDWAQQMEVLITRTGVTDHPRGHDNFNTFLRKIVWDSLVFDQMCFEVVPNRKGQPARWIPVDAASIRLADNASLHADPEDNKAVRYVQVYDGQVIAEFNHEELCFGVRNPSTDMRLAGYGISEAEMLMTTITSMLFGLEYNKRFFTQGSAPKGIINFKGTVPERQLAAFRKFWYGHLSSVGNAWRTPITNSDELQYINLQQSNRDMEFSNYMDFLIKIAASIYLIDPAEVNFRYGNTGQSSALQESSNKEKITESKEKGLRPLLDFVAHTINQHIVWPLNESFEFEFVGLDALTRDQAADLVSKQVKSIRTIDEMRAEEDLPPLPDGKGEVILDPTFLQWAQIKDAAGQEGMEGEGGEMGEGESEGGDEGDEDEGDGEGYDFEALMRQYGGGEDEDEKAEPAKPAKPEKMAASLAPVRGNELIKGTGIVRFDLDL